MRSVVFANQKGGVGKTTSALNVAWLLANNHKSRVLFVDLDPQASATISILGPEVAMSVFRASRTIKNVLAGSCGMAEAIIHKGLVGDDEIPVPFDFVPSHITLSEFDANREIGAEFTLQEAAGSVREGYDWLVIDVPPNLGLLTTTALVAANLVIIPVRTEPLDAMGVKLMVDTVSKVQRRLNPGLRLIGILPTQYTARKTVDQNVINSLTTVFGSQKMLPSIPSSASYGRAAEMGKIAASAYPGKDAIAPYEKLAGILVEHHGGVGGAE